MRRRCRGRRGRGVRGARRVSRGEALRGRYRGGELQWRWAEKANELTEDDYL